MSARGRPTERGGDGPAGEAAGPSAPRRWLELRVRPPERDGDAGALLPDALIDLGARGVVERGGRYVAYFEEPADVDAFLGRARASLVAGTGLDGIEIDHGWQEHDDWAETWRRGLAPRRVTDRLVVRPSWEEPDDPRPGDVVIVLDPGMAFGTAEHGTTRGCLRLIDANVRAGDRVLDVGAGSGILSIAAARLGAREVVAIEGDPLACEALADNLRRNGVEERVHVVPKWTTAEDLAARGPFDGIVANLETHLLTPLFEGFRSALAEGGWLVVSGILEDELDGVLTGLGALGFTTMGVDEDGEWRSAHLELRSA